MADVDIYKKDKVYIIENSPIEGLYFHYEISAQDFDIILNATAPNK